MADKNRPLHILKYLWDHTDEEHPAIITDILAHLEEYGIHTNRKTVASDLAELQDSGFDVVCNKSRQNQYFIGSRSLELAELKMIVDAIQAAKFISESKSLMLIEKVSSLASPHQAEQLKRRLYVEGKAKTTNEAVNYTVDLLQSAIQSQKAVEFQYIEYTPRKEKVLKYDGYVYRFSPYDLVWNNDSYYVFGRISLYNNGYITSVKYNFSDIDCDSGPNTINAYLLTSNWNESTVVYSNSLWNAYGTYIGSTTIAPVSPRPYPYPRYEIDITTAVEMWLTGSATNYGIMLKANDESKEAVVLGTSESGSESVAGRTDSRPYVVVNYSTLRDNQIYRFKNVASGLYMNVSYGYDTNELNVFQTTKDDQHFAQEFRLSYDTNESSYRIHPICSMNGRRRVLDVVKSSSGVGGLTSGCNLQIYSPTDDIAELFNIVSVGTGQYKIVLKYATNIAISANGNSNGSASGTSNSSTGNVIMTEYTGAASQKWVLERSERNEEELYYSVMNVSYPFRGANVPVRLSSGFGYRKHPVTGANYSSHGGIDIPASSGTQLYSVFDGQVKVIGYESNSNSGRGHYIIVEATNDYNNVYLSSQKLRYVYMHMKESPTVTNSQVVKNAYVDINTLIGKVGTTGASTGNHLHLSFIVNGGTSSAIENVVNPMMFYPDIDFTY